MNRFLKVAFLAVLFLIFQAESKAQNFNPKYRYWSIGGTLNIMNYVGDLDPGASFLAPGLKYTRYNFGATALYRFSPRISFRGTLSYGQIGGNDYKNSSYSEAGGASAPINRKARNFSFSNQILELKADVVIDFIEHRGKYQKRPDFVPYMFVGIAYFHHNPTAVTADGQTVSLHDYHTEGQGVLPGAPSQYSLNQIAIPIGLGVRYKLSKQLDLAFEVGFRFTFTDYLDDVGSGAYPDKTALFNAMGGGDMAATAVALSDRSGEVLNTDPGLKPVADQGINSTTGLSNAFNANSRGNSDKRRDMYIVSGLHLTYIIPGKVVCPKFR